MIPRRWRRLKIWGKTIVPFIAPWIGGKPEFGKKSPGRLKRCGIDRVCNVCGQKLDDVMVFAGGAVATYTRIFHEPPLHEECIRASFELCPYLNNLLTGKIDEGGMYLTFARACRFVDNGAHSSYVARSILRVEIVRPDPASFAALCVAGVQPT